MRKSLLAALALAFAAPLPAQEGNPGISDASWLVGRWTGEGLSGRVEEVWSPPVAGRMIGHFQLVRDGAPVLYELGMIEETESGLRLRVKHFNPDFTAWEDRDGWHSFEPVSSAPGELVFNGLRFVREDDGLIATVTLKDSAGIEQDHVLRMRRAPL